ncbi:protein of unknown function [Clostridium sp. USBA 49]|jgi:hypothetical protein|uniref:DUF4430 domain-containing protein n=1 Tax=Clostridium sp. USBA 49 TaxID=1881060 RepID=UPI000999A347|nr:DUF4430 domain-containing protein [Clostridium sp. USBA 49]SKA89042.1 protein of unknown function [Clostridium sp. USBA 49]
MKKSNLIKVGVTVLAVLVLFLGYFGIKNVLSGQSGNKTIVITIKDDTSNKVLVDKKKYKTDAENLAQFLDQYKDEFQVEMQNSQYGRFIVGLKGLKTTDMNKGPWWMYSYNSPSQNVKMKIGEAPGAEQLGLHDKDEIELVFTKNTGM